MQEIEAEYHSVVDLNGIGNERGYTESTDSITLKNPQDDPYLKKTLFKYLRYAYLGGRHTVGCLEEAVEAGSVAYGCYRVAVYDSDYETPAAFVLMLAAAYASFLSHIASLIGVIKIEGPSYHKILKESLGGSAAGAAFLQKHCFQPNFKGVIIGSSLAGLFATVKATLDICKENQPDFFRKPIGVLSNLGINVFFSMLVSTGVTGYSFDIVEGFGREVSNSVYWTTVGLTLGLNLLSESMLVYLEYNKYPNRLERFLGVTASLFRALLYSLEITAFSLIFWFDAVTALQDSTRLTDAELGSIISAGLLFGCAVIFNKLYHDKHFRELAAYYIPDCVKNFFTSHLTLKQHSNEKSAHHSREFAGSELQEYVEESSTPSIFAACKQTLINTWNSFHSVEEIGSPPINEQPLLPGNDVKTNSWWSNISCCFWSNTTRTSDTPVKPSHYLPPLILENPGLLAQA
jgi:hypothetical protein